jgi:tetratricopeptide (TPR) repeat protein
VEGLDELERTAKTRRDQEIQLASGRLKAIDVDKVQNADEVLSLAKAYTGLEDYDTAIRLYERYLAMRPNDTTARIAYARVLSWDKRYSASERQYEKLIEQNPDRADLRLEYAQTLSYDSDFSGAIHMFSSLTDLSDNPRATLYPDVPQKAHYNIGQIYRWYGWNDHAVLEQNRALELDSSYVPAREELDIVRHLRPHSTLEARYTTSHDSDDFTLNRIDVSGEKWTSQRTGWNASIGRHEFSHLGDNVAALAASGGINYRLSDTMLARANVGANFYDQGLGVRPFFGAGAQWMPSLASRAALDFNHYDLVYDVFTLTSLKASAAPVNASFRDPLTINDVRGHYDWDGGGLLSWLADASYGFISDDNRRTAAHGVLAFKLWKEPFVALKADGRYLSHDFRSPRYWSPTDYHSLAGVLQVGQNVRNRFFWSAELKYGNAWEGSVKSNLRAYAANVTVPINDAFDVVASYNYGRSGRLNSILGNSGTDFVNYWQRYWFVGFRAKQLFGHDERNRNPYYYDNRTVGSPVIPPLGETH